MSSSEQDFLYQRKYAVSSDGENSPQGDISAGGLPNKNTEWMQNSYTWLLYVLFIASLWGMVQMTQLFSVAKSTTLVNVAHGVVEIYGGSLARGIASVGCATAVKVPPYLALACLLPPTVAKVLQVTFYFFHWTKGSPDEFTQGEWNGLTFWEQLEAGVPWTKAKKFLMIVPTVLCLIPLVASDYHPRYLAVNLPVCFILLLAKSPLMHRVRILHINATPGIDDNVKRE